MWSFPTPAARLVWWKGSVQDTISRIRDHPYNEKVDLYKPHVTEAKAPLKGASGQQPLPPTPALVVRELKTSRLASPEVAKAASPGGLGLVGMSLDGTLAANIIGLARGKLFLSVDRQTHQRLGLDAQPSNIDVSRRRVTINLSTKAIQDPNSRQSRRAVQCLSRMHPRVYGFVADRKGTPGLGRLFTRGSGSDKVSEASWVSAERTDGEIKDALCPPLSLWSKYWPKDKGTAARLATMLADFFGRLSLRRDPGTERRTGRHMSSLPSPYSDTQMKRQVVRFKSYTGLIHPEFPAERVQLLSESVESGEIPWAAVVVWAPPRAPVSWANKEHSVEVGEQVGGEHHTIIIVLPGDICWMLLAVGSADCAR